MKTSDNISNMISAMNNLNQSWTNRATVRKKPVNSDLTFEDERPDYPVWMIPFWDHPDFQNHDHKLKQKLLSHGWINYNNNTITAEDKIANPAFALMLSDVFPGTEHEDIKLNMIQALIDEHYHTYMHMQANYTTIRRRNLETFSLPNAISYREYCKYYSQLTEDWEKKLLTLVWAIVSEVSINAYLDLIAKDTVIQPLNAAIAKAHNVDEYAHASVCVLASESIFHSLNEKQKRFFINYLPIALNAFVSNDYCVWRSTLESLGFEKVDTIISDCETSASMKTLVRNYSGLKKIAQRLNIIDDIAFEFDSYA